MENRILALGLNPAWQKSLFFDELQFGEVNRAAEAHAIASGKGINFLRAVRTWGTMEAVLVQPVGGETGRLIRDSLREEGLSADIPDKRAAAAAIVRLALHSRAKLAVIPVQDILLLGSDARMNTPSTVGCNWEFRLQRLPKREKLQILRI